MFNKLLKRKEEIEAAYGGELERRELPKKKASRVCVVIPFDYNDQKEWSKKFTWLADALVKMREAFGKFL